MASSPDRDTSTKRGLGLLRRGDRTLVYGKGAVADGFVFLSGVDGATDEDDRPVEGIQAQTVLALERLRRYLEDAGTRIDNAVKLVWYLPDRGDLTAFIAARDAWLEENCPALRTERSFASTLLIVGLATPQMLIEIDCIACDAR